MQIEKSFTAILSTKFGNIFCVIILPTVWVYVHFYESEELADCHLTLFFRVGSGSETTVQNVAHLSADTFLEHARLISLECG